ncbi:hypothetical protein niasHT_011589 [Heterodera trifolii]|uniref:Uncharacterized protein n=1 Tax=Heterodera trifolii TaxID=157864 RepID=A0ABD2LF04_9BILA
MYYAIRPEDWLHLLGHHLLLLLQVPMIYQQGHEDIYEIEPNNGQMAQTELRIGNGTDAVGEGRGRHKDSKLKQLITMNVVADRLIVFTTDEGPTVAEKSRLAADGSQKASNFVVECETPSLFSLWPFIWTILVLVPLFVVAMFAQWHFFRRKLIAAGTYTPPAYNGCSSAQFEMSGMPSFFGTTPTSVPIGAKYGRFC